MRTFWDETRGLLADDIAHKHFSEHSQCLALLAGGLDAVRAERIADSLLKQDGLDRTTIYFTHYLFEAYRLIWPDGPVLRSHEPLAEPQDVRV